MFRLSPSQIRHLLADLQVDDEASVAPSFAWSRRKYAPMHIHGDGMASVREELRRAFPEYVVAFDVLFEAADGAGVALHCDHESLGPFAYDRRAAMRDSHFLSVHFNLTPGGGSLVTLAWPRLSLLHHRVISRFGLYSLPHRVCNRLTAPLVRARARTHPNDVGVGNAFDNMRLHAVTRGAPRVSYVVRLVRRGRGVATSPELLAAARAPASRTLHRALAAHVKGVTEVERVPWPSVRARAPAAR